LRIANALTNGAKNIVALLADSGACRDKNALKEKRRG
jgi:hypothetical protein